MKVDFTGKAKGGEPVVADFVVHVPAGQESLNVVVPWSASRFQSNSKHAALPCEGSVRIGETVYAMEPHECRGVQDFGRGLWPVPLVLELGCGDRRAGRRPHRRQRRREVDDRHRGQRERDLRRGVMEDLRWEYDPSDWMRPWRVRAEHSGMLDVTLEPLFAHRTRMSLGVLETGGVCCFGRWSGTLRVEGNEIRVRDVIGWAEEFAHRW